jgi:transcriptional regulator with XRE-family HTH domain
MSRDAFGPNLRRIRLQRGISLEQIARATRVDAELLEGLERNDFSGWPTGIFARAYVRQYAYAIGVDPDSTVDEFCRWFLEGDRRAEATIREQAEIVGHELVWQDEVPESEGDRRGLQSDPEPVRGPRPHALTAFFVRLRRTLTRA